jgi:hypothetical protein
VKNQETSSNLIDYTSLSSLKLPCKIALHFTMMPVSIDRRIKFISKFKVEKVSLDIVIDS